MNPSACKSNGIKDVNRVNPENTDSGELDQHRGKYKLANSYMGVKCEFERDWVKPKFSGTS